MPLFEVKDWDVPSHTAQDAPSRKRKRPANDDRVQSAHVNIEKLMHKVEKDSVRHARETKRTREASPQKGIRQPSVGNGSHQRTRPPGTGDNPASPSRQTYVVPQSPPKNKPISKASVAIGLTSMQASMKDSLDGARFRWINEMMYTTGSKEGHKLMRDDPNLYKEYHMGFRQQVRSWPSNPISHYISVLSSYAPGTVIADLGCGDAALARTLTPKGFCVLSFDLVADGAFVLEADICNRIPLPGAEDAEKQNQDWIQCIRETWRILRHGGELKIAEVTSRFTDVHQFATIIGDLGFKLISKDESNTHFTLFEFRKVARPPFCDRKWDDLRGMRGVLKPCEYKRR